MTDINDLNNEFKVIGKISSLLPSYIRHCCRAQYDGTDIYVLEANRNIALKMLSLYARKYRFAEVHFEILQQYSAVEMMDLIGEHKSRIIDCMATQNNNGLPKRACLHCPEVGKLIRIMTNTRTEDKECGL